MHFTRSSGILLHPTSLPGKFGIGSLGREAFEFVDFLAYTGQKLWQILPLGPTGYGDSPYQCFSAYAGNPLLINLERLRDDGILSDYDLYTDEEFDDDRVDYGKVIEFKYRIFRRAFENFKRYASDIDLQGFNIFCRKNEWWLDDYSLFIALKENFGKKAWSEWSYPAKFKDPESIRLYAHYLSDEIDFNKFLQYEFFKQWSEVKRYANEHNIAIIGDIPIFVAQDSADVWANPELFLLDEYQNPIKVAGVPPDYFSRTGQLWGNPLYDWRRMRETGYSWWIERFKSSFEIADIIRIDHFRGFSEYWAIPFGEETAINGRWEEAPGMELFLTLQQELGRLPIIAEDLGLITRDVIRLRDYFGFPGMKVLQFAFNPYEESIYLPHLHTKNSVVYTGTHDNDTTVGWYLKTDLYERAFINYYLRTDGRMIHWDMIEAALSSVAVFSIVPLQDVLGLGSSARMNIPSTTEGNWQWRFRWDMITPEIMELLRKLTKMYRR